MGFHREYLKLIKKQAFDKLKEMIKDNSELKERIANVLHAL